VTSTEVVQQALAAVRAGDAEAAAAVVADDFVWAIPGESPIAGEARGFGEWTEKFQRLVGAGLKPQVLATLEGEEHVAALQRNTAEIDGHSLDVRVVNLFTVRDGRVERLETFFDDQRALDAFWSAVLAGA
jgi:hypothetical protein